MQSPNTVKLADVSPDTREEIKIYLSTLKLRKCTLDGKKVKTIEDAILFAKKEAEKVSILEKRIKELEESFEKQEEEIRVLLKEK